MSIRSSFATLALLSFGVLTTTVGCSSTDAKSLCEKEDGCGKKLSAEEVTACQKAAETCTSEADDFAACADGNLECVDNTSTIKAGTCDEELGKLVACQLTTAAK